jgi:hypothetical protein
MKDDEIPADETSATDYEVGYGKPPKHTQFKPGQSGNPRGRSKGTKNLKTDLMEELMEKIDIREGDRSRKVSKQRALLKSVVNRGIKGDARATQIALTTMLRLLDTGEGAPDAEETLLEGEHEILQAFKDRVRRGGVAQIPTEVGHEDNEEDDHEHE